MTFVSYCGILSRFMFMSITPDFIGHPVPSLSSFTGKYDLPLCDGSRCRRFTASPSALHERTSSPPRVRHTRVLRRAYIPLAVRPRKMSPRPRGAQCGPTFVRFLKFYSGQKSFVHFCRIISGVCIFMHIYLHISNILCNFAPQNCLSYEEDFYFDYFVGLPISY